MSEGKYHLYIYPFDIKSKSAIALKEEFNKRGIPCAFVKKQGSKVRNSFIINWGASTMDEGVEDNNTVLNASHVVAYMINKANFYIEHEGNPYVPAVYTVTEARALFSNTHRPFRGFVVRTNVRGSRGQGTHYVETLVQFEALVAGHDDADLLITQYYPKDREFRVHVMNGEIILIQEKKKKHSVDNKDVDWKIRKPDHFAFCRVKSVDVPIPVEAAAKRLLQDGFAADFAGLDIGYHTDSNTAYIYEANSAPGIEGTDIGVYVDAICKHYQA